MPSRSATPPWTLPGGLTGLRGLPKRKVQGTLFVAGRALLGLAHLVGALLAKLAVRRVALFPIVDITVARRVGVALFDELFYKRDHLRNVPGCAGLQIRKFVG